MQLVVLSGEDVRRCVDMETAIDLMAGAFAALSRGAASVPLRTPLEAGAGTTLFMPALLPAGDAAAPRAGGPGRRRHDRPPDAGSAGGLGAKVVSVFPGNRDRGLPTVHAAVLLLDARTGAPAALLDGTALTALRTGAASGLATRLLAREDARVLAVFGAGAQARTQIEAVRAVRPIEEVRIVSRGGDSARALAVELGGEVRAVTNPAEALRGADVVVAATDSATPVFPGEAVEQGAHVNGVGSYTPHMREVDGTLVARTRVVVDSREAARAEAGDLIGAVADGTVGWDHVHAELGEVVDGSRPGRESPGEITFFKSVGSAVQDVAVAAHAVAEAKRLGLGTRAEL